MRRLWIVVVLALAGGSEAAPGPAPAPAPAVSQTAPVTFVTSVQNALPEVATDRRDEEIQVIAEQACADLAAGRTADVVVAGARTLGTGDAEAADPVTARELVKLAIGSVCPDQSGRAAEFG